MSECVCRGIIDKYPIELYWDGHMAESVEARYCPLCGRVLEHGIRQLNYVQCQDLIRGIISEHFDRMQESEELIFEKDTHRWADEMSLMCNIVDFIGRHFPIPFN